MNDPLDGPAFVAGQNGAAGTPENGVITQGVFDIANFAGFQTPTGVTLDAAAIDFASDPSNFVVAVLTVEQVPLPATAPLLFGGLGLFGLTALRRRRRQTTA